jgi:malonyl-CoA O-methyltransferase
MDSKTSPRRPKQQSAPIDLPRVRQLFANPGRVAESTFLRREVASRMYERLELIKLAPQRILDAGCGEGADLVQLQQRFAEAHVLGLDAAPAMLQAARGGQLAASSALNRMLKKWLPATRSNAPQEGASLACGNFAELPLGINTVDLIWSNLALHWHPQPDRVFAEWRRVLRLNGLLMFSCLGPDTFRELRTAFASIDDTPHALAFVDMHDFGDMLMGSGFSTPVMDMETITVTYESTAKLLADARAWGGNPLITRRRGAVGKAAWARMLQALESLRRPDGKIPLSFEIIYGHAFRLAPRFKRAEERNMGPDFSKQGK